MAAIHLTACILTGFDKKYMVIFTPVLLVSIGAVLVEHIKITHNQNRGTWSLASACRTIYKSPVALAFPILFPACTVGIFKMMPTVHFQIFWKIRRMG